MEDEKYKERKIPKIRDMNRRIDRDTRSRGIPKNSTRPKPMANKPPALGDLLDKVEDSSTREEELPTITKEDKRLLKYNQATTILLNQWKQTFRKTDSIELANLIQNSSVSHNALLRLTGSYSTKMLSNLKINNRELSGIESRPTKVFYNREPDFREAIVNNILSYIPYAINYLSTLENDTTKQAHIDNLYLLNEKLYFSLYMYNNEVIEVECINLTKENKVTGNFKITDTRNSLKIFITEEKNNEEILGTIMQELQQNFLFIVLNRTDRSATLQMYNQVGAVPFTIDNLKRLSKDKITALEDDKQYEAIKSKYTREK